MISIGLNANCLGTDVNKKDGEPHLQLVLARDLQLKNHTYFLWKITLKQGRYLFPPKYLSHYNINNTQ